MSLEVRHNRAEHTHENEQFRRVASSLRYFFEQKQWDGLLIGNPFNEAFCRFRADAILFYNHGLVIIDFKDYSGTINLPPHENEFKSSKWYSENPLDKQRIEIKAGSRFINPFRQLQAYREALFEVIRSNIYLNGVINPKRTLALNIFSGPVEIHNSIPKSIPFYKITQETDLPTLLYDYSSENAYSQDSAKALNGVFKAEHWQDHVELPLRTHKAAWCTELEQDVESELSKFLTLDTGGILVLESMDAETRDNWMRYILSEAVEFNVPQTETWSHSARIARKVGNRVGVSIQSLFSTIYGGSAGLDSETEEPDKSNEEINEDQLQELVPLRSNSSLDESAVVILHEAHLVTRSLHQSEILKFGSGRLLEDLINFLQLNTSKRKLICIGDPYSLTFGKAEESALSVNTLGELYNGEIRHYRTPPVIGSQTGKLLFKNKIASQIENNIFNRLQYPWSDADLINIDKERVAVLLKEWFSSPCESEPQRAVLVYSNKKKGAKEVNGWIKKNCIRNGETLAVNDLLIINNNINIPDPTGFGQPTKLYNGMYLLVNNIGEVYTEPITININKSKKRIEFKFIKLNVNCLSIHNKLQTDVWLLDNYFSSEDGLSNEEQIAFRVFVNKRVNDELKKSPFDESFQHNLFKQSPEYLDARSELDELLKQQNAGGAVKTKIDTVERKIRVIERLHKKRHRNWLFAEVAQTDPLVNAIFASYGWAITVHKAVGSSFSHVIFNAYQGENRGITNLDYYRWVYSAMTATTGVSLVVNPQFVSPLMECEVEDVSHAMPGFISKSKTKLIFPSYVVDVCYADKFPGKFKNNVAGAICELTKLIEMDGFMLEAVYCHGDYLTKAHYSCPNHVDSRLILAFDNKGQKDDWAVTSVRIEKSVEVDKERITSAIMRMFTDGGLEFPDDYRGDVYREWASFLKQDGYSLSLTASHDNQDVFDVHGNSSSAKFRAWYTGKGFFTKFSVFEKTDSTILDKISDLMTRCRQNLN